MGSIGDCFDIAVVESFWARMQVELLDRWRWKTRIELANAIFEHIEIFQPQATAQLPRHALSEGVREDARLPIRPGMRSNESTQRNPGNIRLHRSGELQTFPVMQLAS